MREIKYHNGETIKVDGLHFYGCSYIAGQELLDHEIPDPMAIDPKKMAQQKGERVEEYYRRKLARELLFKKKLKLEKQLSWCQHTTNHLKLRCYNHGIHGCSTTQVKGLIVQHMVQGLYEKQKEAIVVGMTGFAREMVFAEDESMLLNVGTIGSARSLVVATHAERRGDVHFAKRYMMLKGVYTLFWNYLHEIYNIINICELNNIKLYLIPMLDPFDPKWYKKQYDIGFKEGEFNEQIKFIESKIDKYIIEDMKLDPLGANIIKRLPRGHPCAESHEKYGTKVGEKLTI